MSRVQLALNVPDIDQAVDFYSKLFATEPAKRRPGYANFAIADPPLKLVLFEKADADARLNHLGVEVMSSDEVLGHQARLTGEGLAPVDEHAFAAWNALWEGALAVHNRRLRLVTERGAETVVWLTSVSPAGAPLPMPVWFLWEDGALWILGSRATDTFPMRIEQDPRCAVGVVDFDRTSGRVQHVGLRGRATIEPFDANRARRLLSPYLGDDQSTWDDRFLRTLKGKEEEVFVRFVPETAVARDVSYDIVGHRQASPLV